MGGDIHAPFTLRDVSPESDNMKIAVVLVALSAITFEQQELPKLSFGKIQSLSGNLSTQFRRVDMDDDGFDDLILSDVVLFQENRKFPLHRTVPLPHSQLPTQRDIFQRSL